VRPKESFEIEQRDVGLGEQIIVNVTRASDPRVRRHPPNEKQRNNANYESRYYFSEPRKCSNVPACFAVVLQSWLGRAAVRRRPVITRPFIERQRTIEREQRGENCRRRLGQNRDRGRKDVKEMPARFWKSEINSERA